MWKDCHRGVTSTISSSSHCMEERNVFLVFMNLTLQTTEGEFSKKLWQFPVFLTVVGGNILIQSSSIFLSFLNWPLRIGSRAKYCMLMSINADTDRVLFLLIWCWWIIGKRSLNWLYLVIQQNLIVHRRIVIHSGSSAISIREQSSSNGGLTSIAQSFSPNGRLPVYSRTSLILSLALERHLNQMRWEAASLQMVLSKCEGRTIEFGERSVTWIAQLSKICPHPIFPIRLKCEIQSKSNRFSPPRGIFNWLRFIGKRSLHVSRLTVSEFSDQGTKGVSVKEGGSVKGRREEGGGNVKEGREEVHHRGKAFSGWPGLDWRQLFGDLL